MNALVEPSSTFEICSVPEIARYCIFVPAMFRPVASYQLSQHYATGFRAHFPNPVSPDFLTMSHSCWPPIATQYLNIVIIVST